MGLRLITLACVALAMLLLSSLLTGCSHVSPASADSRRLYQPPVLRLPAGQPIQTQDGLYQPQTAEIWHSDARFLALASSYTDALAALAASQARNR